MKTMKRSQSMSGEGAQTFATEVREYLEGVYKEAAAARQHVPNWATHLAAMLETNSLPYAQVTASGKVKCPACNVALPAHDDSPPCVRVKTFQYIEDIGNGRDVLGLNGKTLVIDGCYRTDGFDEVGVGERLFCNGCNAEFVMPDGYNEEFI